jgi:hypothetical protein
MKKLVYLKFLKNFVTKNPGLDQEPRIRIRSGLNSSLDPDPYSAKYPESGFTDYGSEALV